MEGKNRKLLIIEDDEALGYELQKLFEGDFEIERCVEGMNAVSHANTFNPNIILLDIILLGVFDGMAILKSLKSVKKTNDIPVVIYTNLPDDKSAEYLSFGAAEYLDKSKTSFAQLREVIFRNIEPKQK